MGNSASTENMPTNVQATGVPCLQVLGFNTFYKELLCKVSPGTVTFVRQCIHQQLMGLMRKKIREKCLEKLNESYKSWHPYHPDTIPDVCVAMDCLLDDSFLDLEIQVPSSNILEMFSKLLSIIAQRSPELRELTITFHGNKMMASTDQLLALKPDDQDSRRFLHSLLQLTLFCKQDNTGNSIACNEPANLDDLFVIVAEMCPALTDLTTRGFCIKKRSMLSLITGAFSNALFSNGDQQWTEGAVLQGLQVPTLFLSPLCPHLKKLLVIRCRRSFCNCEHIALSDATVVFALRHLSAVEVLSLPAACIISAVKILYSQKLSTEKTETQKLFEEHCKGINKNFSVSSLRLPSGSLSLTFLLNHVPIHDPHAVRAVGTMCPNLSNSVTGVTFIGKPSDPRTTGRLSSSSHGEELEMLRAWPKVFFSSSYGEELELMLRAWPKLNRISLYYFGFNPPLLNPVLDVFASHLRHLVLLECERVDLAHLSLCTHLEHLTISHSTFSSEASGPAQWNGANTFLPSLKWLSSNVCLGTSAPLFEKKSTLVDVSLACCHIGTRAYDSDPLEWGKLAELLPNSQSLSLGQVTGLTMTIVSNLIPRLENLRRIGLPSSVMNQEAELTSKLTIDGSMRKTRIQIYRYRYSDFAVPCPYQQM